MPSPFYNQSTGGGRAGAGVSSEGYEGASQFFKGLKTIACQLNLPFLPTGEEMHAAGKASAEAYLNARNGFSATDSFSQTGKMPHEFPRMEISGHNVAMDKTSGLGGAKSELSDLGQGLTDMLSKMGDVLNQVVTGPLGILSSLINFLFKVFSDISSTIVQALNDAARAVAATVEDAWKKQLQTASAGAGTHLPSLELYNHSASTQILGQALSQSANSP